MCYKQSCQSRKARNEMQSWKLADSLSIVDLKLIIMWTMTKISVDMMQTIEDGGKFALGSALALLCAKATWICWTPKQI